MGTHARVTQKVAGGCRPPHLPKVRENNPDLRYFTKICLKSKISRILTVNRPNAERK